MVAEHHVPGLRDLPRRTPAIGGQRHLDLAPGLAAPTHQPTTFQTIDQADGGRMAETDLTGKGSDRLTGLPQQYRQGRPGAWGDILVARGDGIVEQSVKRIEAIEQIRFMHDACIL